MEILHAELPADMRVGRALPGIQPVSGPWLRVDDAYGAQMAQREILLDTQRDKVLACPAHALGPAREVLDMILAQLGDFGFGVGAAEVICPDGRCVRIAHDDPFGTLGRLVQCDLCLLEKPEGGPGGGDEHLLGAAVLCFPANWTLAEKIGRPMLRIHKPVEEYDPVLARRVQRLLDGVQVGRPLWRSNRLYYDDPALHQPQSEADPKRLISHRAERPYFRAERQTLLRLPQSRWVLFAIHTYVLRAADVRDLQ